MLLSVSWLEKEGIGYLAKAAWGTRRSGRAEMDEMVVSHVRVRVANKGDIVPTVPKIG